MCVTPAAKLVQASDFIQLSCWLLTPFAWVENKRKTNIDKNVNFNPLHSDLSSPLFSFHFLLLLSRVSDFISSFTYLFETSASRERCVVSSGDEASKASISIINSLNTRYREREKSSSTAIIINTYEQFVLIYHFTYHNIYTEMK